jgi:hypothetical protein
MEIRADVKQGEKWRVWLPEPKLQQPKEEEKGKK